MKTKEEKRAWAGIGAVVVIAVGLAFAIGSGSVLVAGIPLYALAVVYIFVIQWLAFVPAYLFQTEKFYDLTGSFTYISVVILSLLLNPIINPRSYLVMALVMIWAGRLGIFLFRRVMKSGKDGRFDEIKPSFPRFLLAWTTQGLWVSFTIAAGLAVITSPIQRPLGIFALIGLAIWVIGFGIEAAADWQKKQFRLNPDHKGKFIHTGLWSWSRHPNYFGEITLWVGVAVIAVPILQGWQWAALISPIFVTILLTKISGVPLLEKRADEKWGGQEDYEAYKARTSVLVPLPPKK